MRRVAARGRGNQGDWVGPTRIVYKVPQAHADHNAEVTAKKLAKKEAKKALKIKDLENGKSTPKN